MPVPVFNLENGSGLLEVDTCPVCGILYAVPKRLLNIRHMEGGSWYCPNGHSIIYTETIEQKKNREIDRLNEEKERLRKQMMYERQRANDTERSRRAYKGQLTKVKKRVASGVCPCCNRHFQNLERHMKGQHPDYIQEVKDA